ncbi:hypothetical protein AEGHOMDF_1016 [Methylobacterium soli]|nr:hypothetical protein AEGHOMDF_1016 [Methylobacterium soli]
MFSEKQFRAWQKLGETLAENEPSLREQIAEEVNAAAADIERRRETEEGVAQFRHALRHRDALRARAQPQPPRTTEQEADRRTAIRKQIEREMDAFDLRSPSRKGRTSSRRIAPSPCRPWMR